MSTRVSRWYAALLADPDLPDAARVLGMDLARSGVISERTGHFGWDVPAFSRRLNRHPTRIKERRAALSRAGYVEIVRGHGPGRDAVWGIVIPTGRPGAAGGRRARPQPRGRRAKPGPMEQDWEPGPMEGDLVGVAE